MDVSISCRPATTTSPQTQWSSNSCSKCDTRVRCLLRSAVQRVRCLAARSSGPRWGCLVQIPPYGRDTGPCPSPATGGAARGPLSPKVRLPIGFVIDLPGLLCRPCCRFIRRSARLGGGRIQHVPEVWPIRRSSTLLVWAVDCKWHHIARGTGRERLDWFSISWIVG